MDDDDHHHHQIDIHYSSFLIILVVIGIHQAGEFNQGHKSPVVFCSFNVY
jgi:hypothetical protein